MLYIIGTPIGNIKDITLRAIDTIKSLDVIYCEDTRKTSKILELVEKKIPLKRADANTLERITENILKESITKNIGFMTDAGMPTISDPGTILIAEAHRNSVKFEIIPGVSSLDTGLTGSGFPSQPMQFLGFLPKKKGKKTLIESFRDNESTIVFFESPNRIRKTLQELFDILGERWVCLAREMTKMHEEYIRDSLSNLIKSKFTEKGEFVVILAPSKWFESR